MNRVAKPDRGGSAITGRTRHAIAVLACWTAATAALVVLGIGVGNALSPTAVVVPGTGAASAQALAEKRFGPSQLVPVLLEGPAKSIESQGPGLVNALAGRPHTRVLSPWNAPAGTEGLRPSAHAAMVLVMLAASEAQAIAQQPAIERLVAQHTASPVRASITGQPSIDLALREESLSAAKRYGLIAVGVLLLASLIVLRAPLAAVLVAVLAAAAAMSGLGVMRLLGEAIAVDPVAVPLASMTGLALGGAYCLIVLDRFRREQGQAAAARSEGRGVLLAGTGFVLALAVASAIAPTKVIVSVGVGVLVCGALAALAAAIALPAALALTGWRAVWAVPAPAWARRVRARLALAPATRSRSALVAAPIAIAALVLLSLPVLMLDTGQPGIEQLPSASGARISYERVARAMGQGWPTPYNVLVASKSGPLTTASMLEQIDLLQAQFLQTPAVASVSGPGALSAKTKPLGKLPGALNESGKLLTSGKHDLERLLAGLGQAGAGAQKLQEGLTSAASGASQLHSGAGSAQVGAAKLHAGIATARAGSAMLQAGLEEALAGAKALQDGATQALAGSIELYEGVSSVGVPVHESVPSTRQLKSLTAETSDAIGGLKSQADGASGDLARALGALEAMTIGRADPHYAEAVQGLQDASAAVASVSSGLASAQPNAALAAEGAATLAAQVEFLDAALHQLRHGAHELQVGLGKLRAGNAKLAAGIGRLAAGGGQLTSGLTLLRDGAGELEAGLGLLTGGTGELQSGLEGGVAPVGELVAGLGLLQAGVAKFSGQLPSPKDLEELHRNSPELFSSGYFLLAAIEGAPPQASNAAAFTINVQRGGNASQIAVISRYPSGDPRTSALGDSLSAQERRFARANGLLSALGGPAANLRDLTQAGVQRTWWAILGVAVAVALVLAIGLRAVPIALLSTALALLIAAASFGVLTLLFSGSSPPLGGTGHLDPISEVGIFAAAVGAALAFLVPPLVALRRRLAATATAAPGPEGTSAEARSRAPIEQGLPGAFGHMLAGVLAVAALIPFAISQLSSVREFAVGMALAVALAALVGRTLVLPVACRLLGVRGWWPGCAQLRSEEQQSATSADAHQTPMSGPDPGP